MADSEERIQVLVVEPGEKPYEKVIPNTLEELQKWVDGYIEVVYPFDDPVGIVCNEEAKLEGLELNRGLFDDNGHMYDVICGRFLVVGLTEDDFASLTEEQMLQYKEMYKLPQSFVLIDGQLRSYERQTMEKAYRLAEEISDLSYDSGLIESQVGAKWGSISLGEQREIIQWTEEQYLKGLLTGHDQMLKMHLEGIRERFPDYKKDVERLEGQISEFYKQKEADRNPLKNAEEMLEDDFGMIDGIVNNGKKRDGLEL